jgi:hypothetical protein
MLRRETIRARSVATGSLSIGKICTQKVVFRSFPGLNVLAMRNPEMQSMRPAGGT